MLSIYKVIYIYIYILTADGAKETGVTKHDRREWKGRTPITELQEQSVRDHVNSPPEYTSCYARCYTPRHLSMKKICELYVDK
jgi:hypothetical protein